MRKVFDAKDALAATLKERGLRFPALNGGFLARAGIGCSFAALCAVTRFRILRRSGAIGMVGTGLGILAIIGIAEARTAGPRPAHFPRVYAVGHTIFSSFAFADSTAATVAL